MSVPLVLVRVTVCAAGDWPTGAANASDVGVATSIGVPATTTVIGIVNGLFTAATPVETAVAAMLIEPLQVPAGKPLVAIATVRELFVVPVTGVVAPFRSSQLLPQLVTVGVAVNVSGTPVLLATVIVCAAGAGWPVWKGKLNPAVVFTLVAMNGSLLILRTTGIC